MPLYNKRILIIDDQADLLVEMKKILTASDKGRDILADIENIMSEFSGDFKATSENIALSYEVDTVSNGKDGLDMVKKAKKSGKPYALCFIDMRMPGWDGTKTAKEIRLFQKDIEIVIITAYSDVKCIEIVTEVGIPHKILYLKKPFDREEVSQLAWALIEKWNYDKEREEYLCKLEMAKDGLVTILEILDGMELFSSLAINKLLEGFIKQMVSLFRLQSANLFVSNDEDKKFKYLSNIGISGNCDEGTVFEDQYDGVKDMISSSFKCVVKNDTLFFPIIVRGDIHSICVFNGTDPLTPYPIDTFNMLASTIRKIVENSLKLSQ